MARFSLLMDSTIAIAAYFCIAMFTLMWVYRSGQGRVPQIAETKRLVVSRLAIVVAILLGLCWLVDIAIWIPLLACGVLFLLAWGGDVLGLPGIVMFWVIQQYVLGFPAREEVFLAPFGLTGPDNSSLTELIGKRGTTLSALKPTGQIIIGDATYNAATESRSYLGPEEVVVVTGEKNGMLFVGLPHPADER
ncbi:MAG: NfeD family protein [Planctomycetaceae bacterium]|nr:NfeD family protein [Planctomycetaceae bacterium]